MWTRCPWVVLARVARPARSKDIRISNWMSTSDSPLCRRERSSNTLHSSITACWLTRRWKIFNKSLKLSDTFDWNAKSNKNQAATGREIDHICHIVWATPSAWCRSHAPFWYHGIVCRSAGASTVLPLAYTYMWQCRTHSNVTHSLAPGPELKKHRLWLWIWRLKSTSFKCHFFPSTIGAYYFKHCMYTPMHINGIIRVCHVRSIIRFSFTNCHFFSKLTSHQKPHNLKKF